MKFMQTPLFQEVLTADSLEHTYEPETELQAIGDVWVDNGDLYIEYGYDTLGDDREFNITLTAGAGTDYSSDRFETHNGQGTSTVVFAQIPAEPGDNWLITLGTTDGEYGASQWRVDFGSAGGGGGDGENGDDGQQEDTFGEIVEVLSSPLVLGGAAALFILLVVLATR